MIPAGTHRILVVDDDPDICLNLNDILTDRGYQVDVAHNGSSALELVRATPYDVALLDLRMPGMNGLELYREIKKLRAGTVAILVSAYAQGDTTEQALAAGAWRVLSKPLDPAELDRLLCTALDQPHVLVVDDDRDLCANLWELLRERGYRVGMAYDARTATIQIRACRFHVVLIDMKIPNGTGQDVYRAVRHANPEARTLLITGNQCEMAGLVEQVLADGADGVCYKPFDLDELLGKLDRLARARDA